MLSLDLNWKLTLVTALLLPLLVTLGFWQLDREREKRALQATYDERAQQMPVMLSSLQPEPGQLAYRRVLVYGEYDNYRNFLLDNRIHQSQVGYELLTPFHTDAGVVLVNRGWLPMGPSRQQLPELPAVDGRQQLQATVYVPPGASFVLSDIQEQAAGQWPQVIQRLDMSQISETLGAPVFPYSLRLESGQPGALVTDWPVIVMSPATHRGYAVQWFSMAVVLLILFTYVSVKRKGSKAQ